MNDEFDDQIRSQLQSGDASVAGGAHAALEQLRPAMRRAHLTRRIGVAATACCLVGITGIGILALVGGDEGSSTVDPVLDGDPLPSVADVTTTTTTTTTVAEIDSSPSTTIAPPTTTESPTSTSAPTSAPDSDDSTTADEDAGPPPAPATTPSNTEPTGTVAPTPTVAVTSTAPTSSPTIAPDTTTVTTAAPATTDPPPPPTGQQTIASACGSITVSWVGEAISLVGSQPGAGFSVEVKDAGPDDVDVEFDDEDDRSCEIEAWIEGGTLRTSVDNG